jgi:hypothetical protein
MIVTGILLLLSVQLSNAPVSAPTVKAPATAAAHQGGSIQRTRLIQVSRPDDLAGAAAISAEVDWWSDGAKLHLTVQVHDSAVVQAQDGLKGDHVELWFALPSAADISAPYYLSDARQRKKRYALCMCTGEPWKAPNEPSLCAEECGKKSVPRSVRNASDLADLVARASSGGDDDSVASLDENLSVETDFFGMVHLALFVNNRPAVLLDQDKIPSDVAAGHPERYVHYQSRRTDDGYTIVADIAPQALGWFQVDGPDASCSSLRMLVDVIDADGEKQRALLSTSKNRAWGVPATFSAIHLAPPLQAVIEDSVRRAHELLYRRGVWQLSAKGWQPALFEWEPVAGTGPAGHFCTWNVRNREIDGAVEVHLGPLPVTKGQDGPVNWLALGERRANLYGEFVYELPANGQVTPLRFADNSYGLLTVSSGADLTHGCADSSMAEIKLERRAKELGTTPFFLRLDSSHAETPGQGSTTEPPCQPRLLGSPLITQARLDAVRYTCHNAIERLKELPAPPWQTVVEARLYVAPRLKGQKQLTGLDLRLIGTSAATDPSCRQEDFVLQVSGSEMRLAASSDSTDL